MTERRWDGIFFLLLCIFFLTSTQIYAETATLKIQDLIQEAVKNNPELVAFEARVKAAEYRIPQAKSLPDPMFMTGYENEGTSDPYTFGQNIEGMPADSRWMFSLSQMFPFPGKLALKGEMACRDAESTKAMLDAARLNTISRVKEIYYDLSLAYTNLDLLKSNAFLFSRTEDAALARYAAGMAPQQEIVMAQTEKYMLLEREEMEKQKIKSLEAMLAAALGRDTLTSLGGRPEESAYVPYKYSIDELIKTAYEKNPMLKSKEKMAAAAEAKVRMAKKEFYPDFTLGGTYYARGEELPDMWNLTATINVPLYYKQKQAQGVLEAESSFLETKKDIEAAKLMISSSLRDNYSMMQTAETLMALYKEGLIPKANQDFELSLAGYVSGKVESITVITRLKALIDYELLYRGQFFQREKSIARLEAIAAITNYKTEAK